MILEYAAAAALGAVLGLILRVPTALFLTGIFAAVGAVTILLGGLTGSALVDLVLLIVVFQLFFFIGVLVRQLLRPRRGT